MTFSRGHLRGPRKRRYNTKTGCKRNERNLVVAILNCLRTKPETTAWRMETTGMVAKAGNGELSFVTNAGGRGKPDIAFAKGVYIGLIEVKMPGEHVEAGGEQERWLNDFCHKTGGAWAFECHSVEEAEGAWGMVGEGKNVCLACAGPRTFVRFKMDGQIAEAECQNQNCRGVTNRTGDLKEW